VLRIFSECCELMKLCNINCLDPVFRHTVVIFIRHCYDAAVISPNCGTLKTAGPGVAAPVAHLNIC